MIRANCRIQFTRSDVDFLFKHASKQSLSRIGTRSDLTVEKIDQMLDEETVFRRAYEARDFARFSPHFFFYVGVRRCLRVYDLNDRDLADYVASMLCRFLRAEALYRQTMDGDQLIYLVDMIEELNKSETSEDVFDHHTHIGNYTLFLAGVFPDYLEYLSTYKRRLITRKYYESMGRQHYRLAASHNMARKEDLEGVLTTLSSRFLNVRRALTRLSVDYLVLNRSKAQQTYLSIMNEMDEI